MEDHLLPALSRRIFVAGLALCGTWPAGVRAALPPLAPMLAREASPGISPEGWLVSEKYDGVRALWDGNWLRFRSGRPVSAPDWFLALLPAQALDGELWLARGRFDALSATVRRESPRDEEWRQVRYMVFDLRGSMHPLSSARRTCRRCCRAPAGRRWWRWASSA